VRILFAIYGFVLGGIFASFATVVYDRGKLNKSLGGRSMCVCGMQIPSLHNVPVFGYLFLRGYAKCCGAKIPLHLFVNELIASIFVSVLSYLSPYYGITFIFFIIVLAYILGRLKK